MKKLLILASVSAALSFSTAAAGDKTASKILPNEAKAFVEVFGPVKFADAYGDRAKGGHGTFGQFPAKFETPPHKHTHAYRAVVLKGEMTNPFAGEANPPVMKPGSYWSVAAGEEHTTACVSDTPCEFFMWGSENFDFVPSK